MDDQTRHPRRARVLVAVLALAAVLAGAHRWESARQYDALLAAAADAEQVVQDARRSLGGLVRYSNGLLARTDLEPAQRAAVLDSLAVDAARFPPRLAGPRAAVTRVRPLPWDGELQEARRAYLARLDAWTRFVTAAQEQPDTLLLQRRATRPAREAAARALVAASDGRSTARLGQVRGWLLRR